MLILTFAIPSYEIVNELEVQAHIDVPDVLRPGDPIIFKSKLPFKYLTWNGRPLSSSPRKDAHLWVAGLGIRKTKSGIIYGQFASEKTGLPFSSPTIKHFYKYVRTHIPPKKKSVKLKISKSTWSKMDEKYQKQKKQEKENMLKILRHRTGDLNLSCWNPPVNSKIVSKFGSPRTLPNGYSYKHTGVDLRARTGKKIIAANSGTVVFNDHMIVPGNVVVLDHGDGLFSRYMHLSKVSVTKNHFVESKDKIGEAGATGRVEAPHLHWEVIWNGHTLDPFEFMSRWNQFCDQSLF